MIGLGSLLVLLAIVLLAGGTPSAISLFVALFILNFGWALALSYYMGAIATNDPKASSPHWCRSRWPVRLQLRQRSSRCCCR